MASARGDDDLRHPHPEGRAPHPQQPGRTTTSATPSSGCCSASKTADHSPSELAAHERVTPPSMNRTLNGLEKAGLVARHPADDDARRVRVSITPAGLDADRRDPRPAHGLVLAAARRPHPRRATRPRGGDPDPAPPGRVVTGQLVSAMFRSFAVANYRLLVRRRARVERRHLDAAHRPGLAGPDPAHRRRRHRGRRHDGAAVRAAAACCCRSPGWPPTASTAAGC